MRTLHPRSAERSTRLNDSIHRPPCAVFVVVFVAYVGIYQLPGELRVAREEYKKAVALAEEQKGTTAAAYQKLAQSTSSVSGRFTTPSFTTKVQPRGGKVAPAPVPDEAVESPGN